jgi:transposase
MKLIRVKIAIVFVLFLSVLPINRQTKILFFCKSAQVSGVFLKIFSHLGAKIPKIPASLSAKSEKRWLSQDWCKIISLHLT